MEAKPKKSTTLSEVTLSVQRKRINELESELLSVRRSLAEHENKHHGLERRAVSAEENSEALFNAVRILADVIPPDTAQGRRARQEARVLLEAKKITPPSTLGSSRARKTRRRRKLFLT